MAEPTLPGLPEEILLSILLYLDPADITRLQQVSQKFCRLFRDNIFWRSICLQHSHFHDAYNRRHYALHDTLPPRRLGQKEMVRIMADWDLSYPGESVSWYTEYIQRHGQINISWFQEPYIREGSVRCLNELRGAALYRPQNNKGALFAVSPLDDGSVCMWDVNGTSTKRGAMYAQSKPAILFADNPKANNSLRSRRLDSDVTESIAVDSHRNRALVVVQSRMFEVDLETLTTVDVRQFEWSVRTLSTADPNLPLTVGTTHAMYLCDHRTPTLVSEFLCRASEGIDEFDTSEDNSYHRRTFMEILSDVPLPSYTSLAQPGPGSILHIPGGNDIHVAGRFSNLLRFDRRSFKTIKDSIHSGANLSGLATLPSEFSLGGPYDRAADGRTIVACGEYKTKGSLELYGLDATGQLRDREQSVLKNRQTSSPSKVLSVANHGTRLVVSNGSGIVKWFERDGVTEVRRCQIRQEGDVEADPTGLFANMTASGGPGDMARKLIPTGDEATGGVNRDDVLFWTGERLGLLGFSARAGFSADEFEDEARSAEDFEKERAEREYTEGIRRALQRQAEDVRFVRGLGLAGSGL